MTDLIVDDKNRIVDEEFIILFSETSSNTFTTPTINGFLEGIFLSTNVGVKQVLAYTEKTKKVLIDRTNFAGDRYFVLRTTPDFFKGDLSQIDLSLLAEKFALNEGIVFELEGKRDLILKIIVRYSR